MSRDNRRAVLLCSDMLLYHRARICPVAKAQRAVEKCDQLYWMQWRKAQIKQPSLATAVKFDSGLH
jgi:hypothetical protein